MSVWTSPTPRGKVCPGAPGTGPEAYVVEEE